MTRVISWRRIGSMDGADWQSLPLDDDEDGPVFIGRARDCFICLQDIQVSRRHLRLEVRAGRVIATDIGSANGALLEGKPISTAVWAPGERLVVGLFEFRLSEHDQSDIEDLPDTEAHRDTEVRFRDGAPPLDAAARVRSISQTVPTQGAGRRVEGGASGDVDPRAMEAAQAWVDEVTGRGRRRSKDGSGRATRVKAAAPAVSTAPGSKQDRSQGAAAVTPPAKPPPKPRSTPTPAGDIISRRGRDPSGVSESSAPRPSTGSADLSERPAMRNPDPSSNRPFRRAMAEPSQRPAMSSARARRVPSALLQPLAMVVQLLCLAAIVVTSVVMTVKVILLSVSTRTSEVETTAREVLSGFGVDLSGLLGDDSKASRAFADAVDPWAFAWDIEGYRVLIIGSFVIYALLTLATIAWHAMADRSIVLASPGGDGSMMARLMNSPATWLIPVLNLFQPPRALLRLVGSVADLTSGDRAAVWLWWGQLLVGALLFVSAAVAPSETLDTWGLLQFVVGPLLVIGSAAAAVIVVRETSRRLTVGSQP